MTDGHSVSSKEGVHSAKGVSSRRQEGMLVNFHKNMHVLIERAQRHENRKAPRPEKRVVEVSMGQG